MCSVIAHRGPDAEGVYLGESIGLGMRRLAVIDLETGDQPMGTPDGLVQVVFNGEIYNHAELRRFLIGRGYRFRTQSDTEVLPYLYREMGIRFLEQLNGMFAIALWDAQESTLLLARDRVGIKPLFYSQRGGSLYFGSEVKSILAADGSERQLDLVALDQYFSLEYTATPRTFLSDVHKLPAGGWLRWTAGSVSEGRFWSIPRSVAYLDQPEEETMEELRQTLVEAVKRQMISDVPLGAFLSGGIDSSILVSAMSAAGSAPPKTFSVGFGESSYNELRYAGQVAEHFATDHHEENLQPRFMDFLPTVVSHLDQPIADFSVFPTLLVSQMARRNVTVALSGDGGDELFFGYDTYLADVYSSRYTDRLPRRLRKSMFRLSHAWTLSEKKKGLANSLRRFLEGAAMDPAWQHVRWMIFLSDEARQSVYSADFNAHVHGQLGRTVEELLDNGSSYDRKSNQMACDLQLYLTENILPKVDLMSMSTSLETRVPYLDNEVIDLALRIPSAQKFAHGDRKHILKKAFEKDLPPKLTRRGKEGFSIPMKNWLNSDWNGLMRELLCRENLMRDGLFNPAGVEKLIRQHESNRYNHSHVLWALMLFQLWTERFLAPSAAGESCSAR